MWSCKAERERLTEVGRWTDDSMPAIFIFYHMSEDIPEAQLKEILKPTARRHAAQYGFVVQVAVHDENWAQKLVTADMRERIINNELPVGSDLVLNDAMEVRGGLVYTYYKDGDYDEYIYHEK
jgi:hypothetical protein